MWVPSAEPSFALLLVVSWSCCVHCSNTQPAQVSCNARYSAPCARTNCEYLSTMVASDLSIAVDFSAILQDITDQKYNLETGFYPFVVERSSSVCVAHGSNSSFVGKPLADIFDSVDLTYSNVDALHERFLTADHDWVRYLWTDGGRVNSKLAYVININNTHYLGVGYENQPLPPDIPCSDKFDSWCSLTNVRSLVGKAQFALEAAVSLETFEETVFRISFDDDFKIPEGFYLFMYHFNGELKAHGVLRDSFGKSLSEIVPAKQLGTASDGNALHAQFVNAVQDQNTAWVQYPWQNSIDEDSYTKIAFLVKIVQGEDEYYLGAGFNFLVDDFAKAPLGEACSDKYNLPCSFRTAFQLSSHTLSHLVSSPAPLQNRLQSISSDPSFKHSGFYVFIYSYNNTCLAHGGNELYVGMSLNQVFDYVGIQLNATQLHEQFRSSAQQGGGWVLYDWIAPGTTNNLEKISYIFHISIDGQDYYGGIGFNHARAPVQRFTEKGTGNYGHPILCSSKYELQCSEVNARALLGQALAELTLSSSEASAVTAVGYTRPPIEDVLAEINAQVDRFKFNDFFVSVFAFDGKVGQCGQMDGSGCAIAYGSQDEFEGLTWNEILELEGISSVQGAALHSRFIEKSNSGGGVLVYSWNKVPKRAWTARFRHETASFYIIAEYSKVPLPETCDACSAGNECTGTTQMFCEPIPGTPITRHPAFTAMVILIVAGSLLSVFILRRQKYRNKLKRTALESEMQKMASHLEKQMQGMFQVKRNMPIRTADEYKLKVGDGLTDQSRPKKGARWYWLEDDARISQHIPEMVLDGTNLVSYAGEICGQIEHAYRLYNEGNGFQEFHVDLTNKITSTKNGQKLANASTGSCFEINFETMTQLNSTTKHCRSVHREEVELKAENETLEGLPCLPDDIDFTTEDKEEILPTCIGQIIQVSKVHQSNEWMFGNVLYDPLMEDALRGQSEQTDDGLNAVLAQALHDRPTSGWFPRTTVTTADINQMQKLLKTLGGDGSATLSAPDNWDKSRDGRVEVSKGSAEYDEVVHYFLAALYSQRDSVEVVGVHRIQNVPLWQSFSVKKQTLKTRLSEPNARLFNNTDMSPEGLERRWLFHGTNHSVIPQIEMQGFNRSFAGKNAVAYGRGCYFSRDASYSAHEKYSVPDAKRIQHMFMCRVIVGDWCKGTYDQITPDAKPCNNLELFDSTVDNVTNPSIFVVYHDSQSYPEYLISFKRKPTAL